MHNVIYKAEQGLKKKKRSNYENLKREILPYVLKQIMGNDGKFKPNLKSSYAIKEN